MSIINFAFSETNSRTLAETVTYLIRNLTAPQKFAYEIKASFRDHPKMSVSCLEKMPYLSEASLEGLQICPSVSI